MLNLSFQSQQSYVLTDHLNFQEIQNQFVQQKYHSEHNLSIT